MKTRLDEILQGVEENYLLPFLWQRGEAESVIREEMARVYDSGIRAVCVEARPHPDFLGPRWWRDMDIIYETAKVWLNGQQTGVRICPPYHFEIGESLRLGKNHLVVEVTNTLAKEQADFFSRYAPQEPSGLIGPVRLLYD